MRVTPEEILRCLKFILLVKQTRTKSVHVNLEKCVKVHGDVALRFKVRFGGLERSGITLAAVGGHKCAALEGEGP